MSAVVRCLVSVAAVASLLGAGAGYDPLSVPVGFTPHTLDTVADDARRREIPVRIYLPAETSAAPVVLFSHGLGGSREASPYLGTHWSARGYVAVFLQHPGSDTSVWQGQPSGQRKAAMQEAAGSQNFLLRVKDVPAVLDQLERWNRETGHALARRLDLTRIGMSGHSFGAITTQAVSGQVFGRGDLFSTDARIKAAIMFSPSTRRRGGDPSRAFGDVKIPWLLMTGTKDVAPIGDIDVAARLAVYPALPAGGKYELVLDGAHHSAFSERGGPNESRNPNHHRAILALSTAFWDAWLRDDATAKVWLDGDGPRSVLEKNDRWQHK